MQACICECMLWFRVKKKRERERKRRAKRIGLIRYKFEKNYKLENYYLIGKRRREKIKKKLWNKKFDVMSILCNVM